MNDLEFIKIEDRGAGLVAVFRQPYSMNQTFCLNEENLKIRIANVDREGRDSSIEKEALSVLQTRQKSQ